MILVKSKINGKEVFEEISFEDALKHDNKFDLVFTDEDEEEEFEERLEELEALEDEEEVEEEETSEKNKGDDSWHINLDGINEALNSIGNTVSNLFTSKKKRKKSSVAAAFAFMDDDDLHEIAEGILNNSKEYSEIDLVSLMPFLSVEECDALFMKYIVIGTNKAKSSIVDMAPFVSQECLSHLVDEYVSGKYPDLIMDGLYPYMSSKDVKKVFKYIISKNE